ncbi:hypothetical protein JCM11491_006562 [Sporobolomyces phaffii]
MSSLDHEVRDTSAIQGPTAGLQTPPLSSASDRPPTACQPTSTSYWHTPPESPVDEPSRDRAREFAPSEPSSTLNEDRASQNRGVDRPDSLLSIIAERWQREDAETKRKYLSQPASDSGTTTTTSTAGVDDEVVPKPGEVGRASRTSGSRDETRAGRGACDMP